MKRISLLLLASPFIVGGIKMTRGLRGRLCIAKKRGSTLEVKISPIQFLSPEASAPLNSKGFVFPARK